MISGAPAKTVRLALTVLALALTAGAAAAQDRACVTRVNHTDIVIGPGAIVEDPRISFRERLRGWPSGLWNRAWGQPVPCDSATTIAYLAAVLAVDEVEGYCLATAPDEAGWILVPGERNYRGHCRVTACDRVNALAEDGAALARTVTETVTGRDINSPADGVQALASTSGAMMLTGQASTLAAILGQGATALGAVLTTPAAAVTVVAVGGALYVCSD